MKNIKKAEEAINSQHIKPGSVIYASGNAATPQVLLEQLANDLTIKDITLFTVLPLGDRIKKLFSKERCETLIHRIIFNSHLTREAINQGRAKYQQWHLSEIARHLKRENPPNVAIVSVAGPDIGNNFSLGTTVEAVLPAIREVKRNNGIVIAERNDQMPFVLGTTIKKDDIDYILDVNYPLPNSPVHEPDKKASRIGEIIASLYIQDGRGSEPGSTLQYGIGQVPEAVTAAIIKRGLKDLGIHTELFASGMIRLVEKGIVTNRWKERINFSVSSIFLSENSDGYYWLDFNSSVQSRPSDYTNSIFRIADQPRMVSINSAIGVDLHGNVWADSLDARKIYSGIGGQSDFIRGAQYSPGGVAIIGMKSQTEKGKSKIYDMCPAGITTTAIPADQVIIVTEFGAFDPRGLSIGEHAMGIAHLADPRQKEILLKKIYDDPAFHHPRRRRKKPRGFIPYEEAVKRLDDPQAQTLA